MVGSLSFHSLRYILLTLVQGLAYVVHLKCHVILIF